MLYGIKYIKLILGCRHIIPRVPMYKRSVSKFYIKYVHVDLWIIFIFLITVVNDARFI
jgi:hypothetical protein